MERRIITTDVIEEDLKTEGNLRPQLLVDYIGQEKAKENLKVYIEAAKQRNDALDHVLFYGPPGLGKTTLAGIIANEMGVHLKVTSGPAIEKPGEMAAILNNLQEHDVLFVDEIIRSAKVLGVEIDEEGAMEMARRSRGTPRLANRLLKRVRDFAQVRYDGKITKEVADFALNLLEVDRYGLDQIDRRILSTIMVQFSGGPVGLDTLAAAIGEDSGTIEDVYEPYLIKNGFLVRTPRGRVAGDFAYEHLGIDRRS